MDGEDRLRVRGASRELQQVAREMRAEMTPAEHLLWEQLRDKKLDGLRFRAQHPLGQVILDFYCASCRLVLEVDGGVHDRRQEEDAARTQHLAAYACRVLRFRNEAVLSDLPSVIAAIRQAAQDNAKQALSDSPLGCSGSRIGGRGAILMRRFRL